MRYRSLLLIQLFCFNFSLKYEKPSGKNLKLQFLLNVKLNDFKNMHAIKINWAFLKIVNGILSYLHHYSIPGIPDAIEIRKLKKIQDLHIFIHQGLSDFKNKSKYINTRFQFLHHRITPVRFLSLEISLYATHYWKA